MSQAPPKSNRGPAAAEANRAALLASAQRLFRERGYSVPLSAIAKDAGVGQGVLYRHFPTRLDLAFAAFEDHFHMYERIADDDDPGAFFRLWDAIMENLITSTAFIDMVTDARTQRPAYDGEDRLRTLVTAPLTRARGAGLLDAGIEVDDVVLTIRMAYGIVRTSAGGHADLRRTLRGAFPQFLPR